MYKVHSAVQEVWEKHPVDNGSACDGQDGEHRGQVAGPAAQEQTAEIIELGYLGGLAVDVIHLDDPVGGVQAQGGNQGHAHQTHGKSSLKLAKYFGGKDFFSVYLL